MYVFGVDYFEAKNMYSITPSSIIQTHCREEIQDSRVYTFPQTLFLFLAK